MYDNKTRKVIEINPDLFTLKKSIKNKKLKKFKPQPIIQSNQVKKELLKKIKDYQKKNQNKLNKEEKDKILERSEEKDKILERSEKKDDTEVIFDDEFNKSLNFLTELSKDKYQEKIKKQTLKKEKKEQNRNVNDKIKLELPHEFNIEKNEKIFEVSEDDNLNKIINKKDENENNLNSISNNAISNTEIPYGCLKGGFKPTFREWKRDTQKKNLEVCKDNSSGFEILNIDTLSNKNNEENDFSERQNKLKLLRNDFYKEKEKENLQKIVPLIDRKTKTTKYKLGKQGNKVSILIKNSITRKNIKEDLTALKKKSILEVKNYLRKHNLLKIGSNAPNDVLRQIYEQSIMAGDINNKNNNNLLHNYFS